MPYPPAITLRPCTVGGSTALESGTQLVLSAEITASRSLKWGATGWQFPSLTRTITGTEGAELSFSLPVTDLAGWRLNDDSGSIIDVSTPGSYTHTYTVKLKTLSGGRQIDERTIGPFVLPTEDLSPIDLDLMLPAPTIAGGVVSVPGTWDARVAAAEAAAAGLPGIVDSRTIENAMDEDFLLSLRQAAQINASPTLIASTEMSFGTGYTSGNTATWASVTGSTFTFVAPLSGRVQVQIALGYTMPAGAADLTMRLVDGAVNPYTGSERRLAYQPATALAIQGQAKYVAHLDKLPPGATVTCVISVRNTSSTSQAAVKGDATFGPAMVDVYAYPAAMPSDTAELVRGTATKLAAWAAAKAAVAGGSADAKVLLIGDSTQAGYLLDDPAVRLAALLAGTGLAAQPGGTTPRLSPGSNPRYTAGTGWPSGINYGFGSQGWQYSNPAGALTYADANVTADSFDVYFVRGSGATSITLQIDSETPQLFDTTGSTGVGKLTIASGAGASTTHALSITAVGTGAILFVEPWLSTAKRIRVANAGAPSTNSATWAGGTGIYSRALMQLYDPDVVICLLGANDVIDPTNTASSVFAGNVAALAAAVPDAAFVVASPIPSQVELEYQRMKVYAARARYALPFPFVDLLQRFGSWSEANAAGWMSDVRHPNGDGMQQQADAYADMLALA